MYFIRTLLLIVLIALAASGCSGTIDTEGMEEKLGVSNPTAPPEEQTESLTQAAPEKPPTRTASKPEETNPTVTAQRTTPTPIPTSEHYAPSRLKAVPQGETANIGKVEFLISGLIRPANELVSQASDANRKPPEGMEYVFVDLAEACAAPIHIECFISVRDMRLIGSSGIERRSIKIIGHPVMMGDKHIKGGTPGYGFVAFMVGEDESDLMFYYDSGEGDEMVYLLVE